MMLVRAFPEVGNTFNLPIYNVLMQAPTILGQFKQNVCTKLSTTAFNLA
jgi:hypothetical protein